MAKRVRVREDEAVGGDGTQRGRSFVQNMSQVRLFAAQSTRKEGSAQVSLVLYTASGLNASGRANKHGRCNRNSISTQLITFSQVSSDRNREGIPNPVIIVGSSSSIIEFVASSADFDRAK